jgi:hypothetical protein
MKKLCRPFDEMLCLARVRAFRGDMITVPPMGRDGFRWRPWYTRTIYRNGYQERQHVRSFGMWKDIASRRWRLTS